MLINSDGFNYLNRIANTGVISCEPKELQAPQTQTSADSFVLSASNSRSYEQNISTKPDFAKSETRSADSVNKYISVLGGDISRVNTESEQKQIDSILEQHRDWPSVTFIYDASQAKHIKNPVLVGSFNPQTGAHDPEWNQGIGVAMLDDGKGGDLFAADGLYTASVKLDPGFNGEHQWGVKGDITNSKGETIAKNQWLIMTEDPPKFSIDMKEVAQNGTQTEFYSPATTHLMGVHKKGEDGISFKTWAPAVGSGSLSGATMNVDVYNEDGSELMKTIPMTKDLKTGNWSLELASGWKELEAKPYKYSMRDAAGEIVKAGKGDKKAEVSYSDPYARYVQGQQRGVERIFVDPVLGIETGWYNDSGSGGPNYQLNQNWGRFTVNDNLDADRVALVFHDENGNKLSKQQLLDRLGSPELIPYDKASAGQKRNADILKTWQLDVSGKVTNYKWTDGVSEDGSISMHKVGGDKVTGGWLTNINNFEKLEGLQYEFQVYKDGKLVGDKNNDGILQVAERKATPFNDPYNNTISARPGSERMSLIKESNFEFKHSDVPRKESDFKKYTIYEAHVGSFRTTKDNAVPTKFSDMVKYLSYVEDLGYNTVEIMPFNEFGGKRDWGYTPDFYFAGAEAYGFEMDRKEAVEKGIIRKDQDKDKDSVWVSGTDAVKVFVDEAHKRGLNVICDVVYNHTSGKTDGDNVLWQIDGDQNSFFKWPGGNHSETPWGTKPNYAEQGVKNFFSDNALQQIKEFGVDGIRFDFTQVLHNTGNSFEQREGMNTLRQINRTLAFFSPDGKPYTVAEDFTQNWLVAADLEDAQWQGDMEKRGMGFDGVWNGPVHHDLIGAIEGKKNMDGLMETLLSHKGVNAPEKAVVFSHSHDEVGNSGTWAIRAGAKSRDDAKVMENYPRAISRAAAAIIHTMPGVPMVFQGEEFLANNDFKHGATSTWGADYSWLDFRVTPDKLDQFKHIVSMPENERSGAVSSLSANDREMLKKYASASPEEKANMEQYSLKTGQAGVYRALNELRASSNAFNADAPMHKIYTHNDNKVMAYERTDGKDRFIVLTNMADRDYTNYKMDIPAGNWKEVFNSNAKEFGGSGLGNFGGECSGSAGINLPAGSTIVLKA